MPIHSDATHGEPTRWHVITGAPCSGKTTIIEALAAMGYPTVAEAARAYIDSQLKRGRPLAALKANILSFERHILLEKHATEGRLPLDQLIFLDRAIPDSIAYYKLEGLATDEPLRYCRQRRYRKVFIFDILEYLQDEVRAESRAMAMRIDRLLLEAYAALGYAPVRVPVMSVDQRLAFVLSHLSQDGAHSK